MPLFSDGSGLRTPTRHHVADAEQWALLAGVVLARRGRFHRPHSPHRVRSAESSVETESPTRRTRLDACNYNRRDHSVRSAASDALVLFRDIGPNRFADRTDSAL